MKVLALEPYWGGSHKAFLSGWSSRSSHSWDILTLPPYKWKWRMRHAAATFADMSGERFEQGDEWDCIVCSDMLNSAEFKGLAPQHVRNLPMVCYFHENQLTYPVRHEDERDYHFVMANIMTCRAADRIWFNSDFHRESFLNALPGFLKKMPDHTGFVNGEMIREKSLICYPGIDTVPAAEPGTGEGPLRILWAARWEHDKNPDDFFRALSMLRDQGIDFRLNVAGEQFREYPAVFDRAREEFSDNIDTWGFRESREEYISVLQESDVMVSTAVHEFFGISAVEAASAGAVPLVPERLSYPEIFPPCEDPCGCSFIYGTTAEQLASRLEELALLQNKTVVWQQIRGCAKKRAEKYAWDRLVPEYDRLLNSL